MHTDFCIEAVNEAIQKYGTPEIINTDKGSQARADLTQYIRFYNDIRGHQAVNVQTPDRVYFSNRLAAKAV
jgi:putative transposase